MAMTVEEQLEHEKGNIRDLKMQVKVLTDQNTELSKKLGESEKNLAIATETLKLRDKEVIRLQKIEDQFKEMSAAHTNLKTAHDQLRSKVVTLAGQIWDLNGGDEEDRKRRIADAESAKAQAEAMLASLKKN